MTEKPGVAVDVPGRGPLTVKRIVTDYTGTLSYGGKIAAGVQERLIRLAEVVDIVVLTSDTFGTARFELQNIPLRIEILEGAGHDLQKERFVTTECDPAQVAAFGNGNNDRLMLAAVKKAGGLAVAVDTGEGCNVEALVNASILIHGAANAFDLLLEPLRIKAGLRY